MATFMKIAYAEIQFIYDFCNGKALAAQRRYEYRYTNRRVFDKWNCQSDNSL